MRRAGKDVCECVWGGLAGKRDLRVVAWGLLGNRDLIFDLQVGEMP